MEMKQRLKNVGKGLLLVAALLVCGLPALFLASPISYIPLIAVVLLVAASWVYLRILVRSFSFSEHQLKDGCQRGSQVGLSFTLSNGCPLPHSRVDVALYLTDLFGEYDALRTMTVALGPKETCDLAFEACFNHVGTYQAGIDHIVVNDLLGLFSARINNHRQGAITVRPRSFDLRDLEVSEVSEQEDLNLLKPIVSDSTDYASVREYRYGDPLKTVHWNLSARNPEGTMYTRLFEAYVSPTMSLIIDPFSDLPGSSAQAETRETLMSLFDGLIEGAAAFYEYARQQGVDCTIRYLDRQLEAATVRLGSPQDVDELVMGAHRIMPVGENASSRGIPLELLHGELDSSHGASNIAYVCCRLDDDIVEGLLAVKRQRRNPLLLLCVPASLESKARAERLLPLRQLSARGVSCVVLESTELETRMVRP